MNKFMKKLMSKKDGFTLVELIVVIAILAILAGIAIPAYSGYLKSANKAADITALSAVKTAVQGAHATATMPTYIKVVDGATDAITVGTSDSDDEAMTGDVLADFKTFMNIAADGDFAIVLKSGSTAEWVNGEWTISGTPYTP